MDTIKTVIEWFQTNGKDLAVVITSIIGTASVIVKLTPSPADDAILGKIKKFISKFIALN